MKHSQPRQRAPYSSTGVGNNMLDPFKRVRFLSNARHQMNRSICTYARVFVIKYRISLRFIVIL